MIVSVANHLVAVLHSRPVGTGNATLRRVEIARRALGCDSYSVANLYPTVLPNVNALSSAAADHIWEVGREEIQRELECTRTTDVLLGYGVQLPAGENRQRFRNQLNWLENQLRLTSFRVWTYGGRPSHPSRWQRIAHRKDPAGSVEDLAVALLAPHTYRIRAFE
jgi:hypothetical protein